MLGDGENKPKRDELEEPSLRLDPKKLENSEPAKMSSSLLPELELKGLGDGLGGVELHSEAAFAFAAFFSGKELLIDSVAVEEVADEETADGEAAGWLGVESRNCESAKLLAEVVEAAVDGLEDGSEDF